MNGARVLPWDAAHAAGAVPIDVKEHGAGEVTIAYATPVGPKGRTLPATDPGVAEAVARFRRAAAGAAPPARRVFGAFTRPHQENGTGLVGPQKEKRNGHG